jgi:beta-fructofuranosidase
MKSNKHSLNAICVLSCVITFISGCSDTNISSNFGFEIGNLSGWHVIGDSYSVTDNTRYDRFRYYLHEGTYHAIGNDSAIGLIRSSVFKITKSGYISLLLSGGQNSDLAYVTIHRKNGSEILKLSNEHYDYGGLSDTYIRYNIDLSEYLNSYVYLQINDNDAAGTINFDDLIIDITQSQLELLETDRYVRLGISLDPNMRKAADTYIRLNAHKIDEERRFSFHLTGETGWINDPNGFSHYDGKIHLYYQHNPYSTNWGPMHWGHATTTDFVTWEYQNVALAPDQDYDSVGAFSGSAIEWNGKYYLVYTGASHAGQVQAIAVSEDGIHFDKYDDNPVISQIDLPIDTTIADFRDPKVFVKDDWVYLIVSARNVSNSYSKLLLYKSQNMTDWQYAGRTFANGATYATTLGVMMECPDLIEFANQDVLIVSPQTVSDHRNKDGNVFIVGNMNWTTGQLENIVMNSIEEIDHGFDFYAPQTMKMPDGRIVMVAWMAGWSRRPITSEFGFAGAMTFPRELKLINSHLYQYPVNELNNYRQNHTNLTFDNIQGVHYDNRLGGVTKDIELSFAPSAGKTGIQVFDDKQGNSVEIYYDDGFLTVRRYGITDGYYVQDAKNNEVSVSLPLVDGRVVLRILIDKYSVEIFGAAGYRTITLTGMPKSDQTHLGVYSDIPNTITVDSYDIVV